MSPLALPSDGLDRPVFTSKAVADRLYGTAARRMFRRLKFRLRWFWYARAQRSLVHLLATEPLRPLAAKIPTLFEKLHRPYVHQGWSIHRRLAVLGAHYRWLSAPHLQPLRHALLGDEIELASWTAEEVPLRLVMAVDPVFTREGELVISLLDADSRRLGSIALVNAGGDSWWIGALQGLTGADARDCYRDLTRALQGIRPKTLLLIAAQQLARAGGTAELRAVGNSAHVYRARRYGGARRVLADYDEFWSESGGERLDEGSYRLPLRYEVPPRESVPSKKRAMYERRRALVTALQQQIGERLAALGLETG